MQFQSPVDNVPYCMPSLEFPLWYLTIPFNSLLVEGMQVCAPCPWHHMKQR